MIFSIFYSKPGHIVPFGTFFVPGPVIFVPIYGIIATLCGKINVDEGRTVTYPGVFATVAG